MSLLLFLSLLLLFFNPSAFSYAARFPYEVVAGADVVVHVVVDLDVLLCCKDHYQGAIFIYA